MKNNTAPTTPATPTTFGEFLRAFRTARGIGLVELARAAGIDPGLLSRIERGQRKPPNAVMIQHLLGPLGIEEESDEHKALYRLSGRRLMTRDELWKAVVEANAGREPPDSTPCRNIAEMVGRAAEHAFSIGAIEIMVRDENDEVKKFHLSRNLGS
jgi:transcriptional regulator with XRE-family HTH domain